MNVSDTTGELELTGDHWEGQQRQVILALTSNDKLTCNWHLSVAPLFIAFITEHKDNNTDELFSTTSPLNRWLMESLFSHPWYSLWPVHNFIAVDKFIWDSIRWQNSVEHLMRFLLQCLSTNCGSLRKLVPLPFSKLRFGLNHLDASSCKRKKYKWLYFSN